MPVEFTNGVKCEIINHVMNGCLGHCKKEHPSELILKQKACKKWLGVQLPFKHTVSLIVWHNSMMPSSNGNIFGVTGPLYGEFTGHPVNSPHKGQWRGDLMFSLICVRINGWVYNREAGDFKRHLAQYDVTVMTTIILLWLFLNFCKLSDNWNSCYGQTIISQIWFNTLRPRQHGRQFPDDTFKHILWNKNARISIEFSPKFVPKGSINNIPALVQIMAWHRTGDKPLFKPVLVRLPTDTCVTRTQIKFRTLYQDEGHRVQRHPKAAADGHKGISCNIII